jgi:hypothetical protein
MSDTIAEHSEVCLCRSAIAAEHGDEQVPGDVSKAVIASGSFAKISSL